MNKSPGRGRRAGSPDTKAQILAVAHRRFLVEGYHAVTLRSIAAEAGVDVALVSYHFGAKKGLFGAALALAANPAEILVATLEGDPATFPQRALRAMLTVWDDPQVAAPLRAMLGGAAQDEALAVLVEQVVEREMIDKVAARIGGPDAHRRACDFCTVMAGLIVTRCVLHLQPIAAQPVDEIVRHWTPPLRYALRGPAATRRSAGPR
ncbi:TetR family transcriptional regulator [Kitasatospora sp. NPDC094015]|uniref:TetR/AcrR family transcriptional regulator n=1 Tax=Kitasatospora sp. NPDC094015 TaxID=3155205 RepID=UPI003318E201